MSCRVSSARGRSQTSCAGKCRRPSRSSSARHSMTERSHDNAERGVALVSVLIGVMLLSLIAASMLSSGRTAYRVAANAVVRAQAEAVAQAGITRAILALTDPRAGHRWRIDGAPYRFEFEGAP